MIPKFPIPDSGIPNSEFRMAYGNPGIPHHEIAGSVGAHGLRVGGDGVVGHGMSYTNSRGRTPDVLGGQNEDQGNLIHIGSGPL